MSEFQTGEHPVGRTPHPGAPPQEGREHVHPNLATGSARLSAAALDGDDDVGGRSFDAPPAVRRGAGSGRALHAVAYGIALLVLVGIPLTSATQEGGSPLDVVGYDFGAYYRAGQAIRDGASPYLTETLAGPFYLKVRFAYLYPPPFAVAMLPFTLLPPPAANVAWTALLGLGMLLAGATIAGRGDPRRADHPVAVVVALALGLSAPGISDVGQGAVSCMLGVLCLAPLATIKRDGQRDDLAGAATAVAALAKIEPGLWGAYLLGAGRFRAVLAAAGAGLGIISLTMLLPGVRAGWADYPRVLANAAASERAIGGNSGLAALLGLAPSGAHLLETALLVIAVVLMLLAGRVGMRFAPLASVTGLLATPTLWSHAVFLVVPAALVVVARGTGAILGSGRHGRSVSGVRLAELIAACFFVASYACFLGGFDRFSIYVLSLSTALAAFLWGPREQLS